MHKYYKYRFKFKKAGPMSYGMESMLLLKDNTNCFFNQPLPAQIYAFNLHSLRRLFASWVKVLWHDVYAIIERL